MRTFSTYYEKYSGELATYSEWYREHEQPDMTDEEFVHFVQTGELHPDYIHYLTMRARAQVVHLKAANDG